MSDDRLRDLERRARAGEGDAALAWAAALERLGRPDDAFDALWPARADARVRRELSRWTERWRLGEARPVQSSPRVRWATEPEPGEPILSVLVHPLGPVVTTPRRSFALDRGTGQCRVRFRERVSALAGSLALKLRRSRATGWDLWTGRRVLEAPLVGRAHTAFVVDDRIARCARGWLRVERLADDPRLQEGWHHDLGTMLLGTAVISGDRVVVSGKTLEKPGRPLPHDVRGLDLEGRLLWRREGDGRILVHALGAGEVALEESLRVTLVDREGRARWSVPMAGRVFAAGPDALIVDAASPSAAILALDRATGRTIMRYERARERGGDVRVQRDVVVVADGERVQAIGRTGARLWELDLVSELASTGPVLLWPAGGCLYANVGSSLLACIDEG